MIVLGYIGNHRKDGFMARLGWGLIRLGQSKHRFGKVTHTEAVLCGQWWNCTIASATARDDATIRIKTTELNPEHWIVLDVPLWDREKSETWFKANVGTPYSKLGAAASASMLVAMVLDIAKVDVLTLGSWCSRAVPESVGVQGAEDLSPSEVFTLAWALPGTVDITVQFFGVART